MPRSLAPALHLCGQLQRSLLLRSLHCCPTRLERLPASPSLLPSYHRYPQHRHHPRSGQVGPGQGRKFVRAGSHCRSLRLAGGLRHLSAARLPGLADSTLLHSPHCSHSSPHGCRSAHCNYFHRHSSRHQQSFAFLGSLHLAHSLSPLTALTNIFLIQRMTTSRAMKKSPEDALTLQPEVAAGQAGLLASR